MSEQTTITEAKTAARAAALWWAEQIGAPVFRNTGDRDSLEDRRNGDLAGMMALLVSSNHPVTDEAGAKFADALEQHVAGLLDRIAWVSLGTDYGPDYELGEIARAAGINTSRFPWKTHMSITREYVTAALGYGAWSRLIWSAPDWTRPACGQNDWLEGGPRNVICSKLKFHEPDHGDWIPDPARCEDCGGAYADHYGRSSRLDHSWRPTVPDGAS